MGTCSKIVSREETPRKQILALIFLQFFGKVVLLSNPNTMQSSPTLIFLVAALAPLARAAPGPRFSNPVFYDENYSANYEVNPINPIGDMDDQESAKLLSDDNLSKKEGFSDQPLKDNMKSAVDGRPGRSKEDKLKAKSDNPLANDIYVSGKYELVADISHIDLENYY